MSERFLTASELAELLGFAPGTIVDWAEAGTIPAFKLGGRLRFHLSEIEVWLEASRLKGRVTEERLHPSPTNHPARSVVLQAHPSPS